MKFFAFLFASMFSAYAYSQPVIIAHRGDNKYAPENSVEAAEIAWKNGIKFVECDIYETPAGMVCIHGKSELKSLTGCAKEISELTAEDLKELQDVFHLFLFDILGMVDESAGAGNDTSREAFAKAVDLLLSIRQQAKANKDWATSDKIRNELTAIGFTIKDTKDGAEWKI